MPTQPELWRLDSTSGTIMVVHDHDVPRLLWFGSRLHDDVQVDQVLAHDHSALPHGGLDALAPLTLFPQSSTGYMGSAALNTHRNGSQFSHSLITENISISDNTLHMVLADHNAGLAVTISLTLDPHSGVASIATRLCNSGNTPCTIDWLASATLPMPDSYGECLSQHGRWGLENQTHRRQISPGRLDISNLHGRTSHEHTPGIVCGTRGFNLDSGDVTYAHFGWSGNFSLRLEQLSDSTIALQTGVLYLPGECILAPGETLQTPTLSFVRGNGMNTCTQRMHRYIRECVLPAWTRKPRPVHANSWEALYFNHDSRELMTLIDAAARIGAERFVLDDGWFRHRRLDNAGLGDWFVDENVYPEGLSSIVNHVRQHGMQFGLWFEPEMVNPDSDLYRQHPDWALQVAGIPTPLARNQLVLDISRDDVADYLFERITSLVTEYAIDYIKWDHNRDLVLPGDGSHARAARQPEALYRLLRRILGTCPALEIETCSSGGARSDLAVLKYTGRVWASDNIDPVERTSIQQGFMRFMPPEIMGAHVGHAKAHMTGRVTSLHTRAIVALQGQFGFELDARKLDFQEAEALQHYTNLYKTNRQWLGNATFWQLATGSDTLIASGNVDENLTKALFSIVSTGSTTGTRPARLSLKGLDPGADYLLRLESSNLDELAPFNKIFPSWCEEPVRTTGELLMTLGISLPVLPPQTALLVGCWRKV